METEAVEPGVRAGRREWLGLAVLIVPSMLAMIDLTVLFLALPKITVDLGANATQQLWISDVYGFLIAGFLVTMGTLGDRVGRRLVLLVGASAFAVLSVVAAYANSAEMLIVVRALMGIAGATIFPSTLAMINGMFKNPKQLGVAVAAWATALTGGAAIGPVVGGVLLHWFWWGSVFLIAVPVMALLLIAGPALLPNLKAPDTGRIDPLSVLLSLAAILPFIYGLKEVARTGWHLTPVLVSVAGIVFGLLFAMRQRSLASPLLDLRLFAIRAVSGALALGLLSAIIQGGASFFITQHLQLVRGLSPLSAGLWLLVPTLALVLGIFISMGLAQEVVKPAYILSVGAVIAAIGMVVLTQIGPASGLSTLIIGAVIVYVGGAPVGPMVSQIVVPSSPPEKAGSASALQSTAGELGLSLGIALLGSIGAAVYRGEISVPAPLAGTPEGDVASETVAGALTVAQNQPADVAGALVQSARSAFDNGMNAAAVVGAIAFLALALLPLVTLRHIRPFGAQEKEAKAAAEAKANIGKQPSGHDAPASAAID
ncbi:MFS transporter [Dactylosporangium sp. McL0621]|uniref:MFS transporter n=1 Tax=Dactylosporangium sp. McL0621 TaxID=3415678 RepID=UPI003CEB05E7